MAAYGDVVDSSTQTDRRDAIDPQIALRRIVGQFGFLSANHVAGYDLIRLTDPKYGPVKSGNVVPLIRHRLVWLFVFDHFTEPYGGPPEAASQIAAAQDAANGRMWVAVDAQTGKVLLGRDIV